MKLLLPGLLASITGLASATSTFSPVRPPAIPLAVKSPYLNTWLYAGSDSGGNGGYLAGQWPQHWATSVTGWAGIIRVDGTSYTWMGRPPGPANVNQTAFEYTSTKSTFVMDVAGLVSMTVSFLSPVYPEDMSRQSLVFSYLDVTVESADGNSHDVEVYSDISAEWISGDKTAIAEWQYGNAGDAGSYQGSVAYHQIYRQTQLAFSEIADQTEYGSWFYATSVVDGLSFQSGADVDVRGQFTSNGKLADTNDTKFRAINDASPVFGFAVDLGSVTGSVSTLFTIGMTQEEAIQFDGATGIIPLPSLWTSYYQTDLDALAFFHNDYSSAASTSATLDSKIANDSIAAANQDYLTITSLSVRQAFGATQLTGNTTTVYLFLKEISSDGNVQTVDVIFPFHPILSYTNPALLKLLLDPLFENQESGQYPNTYSMHDLGGSYPNATGHTDGADEKQPLEECGNMLIMTLAYIQRASDIAYGTKHYDILKQWTGYLVDEALIPQDQISTDDFAGSLANQTNLALKGIIGIGAMAQIANLTGNAADAANFSSIATSYITQWQDYGIAKDDSPPHTTLSYGNNNTHGLLYNLFGDAELGLDLVPQSVYDMQSAFYPTVTNEYGVPLDTRHTYTKLDWESFCAAIAHVDTRNSLNAMMAKWVDQTPSSRPLTDLYETETGDYANGVTFAGRPVVGGTFALLALPVVEGPTMKIPNLASIVKGDYKQPPKSGEP